MLWSFDHRLSEVSGGDSGKWWVNILSEGATKKSRFEARRLLQIGHENVRIQIRKFIAAHGGFRN